MASFLSEIRCWQHPYIAAFTELAPSPIESISYNVVCCTILLILLPFTKVEIQIINNINKYFIKHLQVHGLKFGFFSSQNWF